MTQPPTPDECVTLTRKQWRVLLGGVALAAVVAVVGALIITLTFRDEVRSDRGIVERAQRGHHLCRSVPSCRAEFRRLERAAAP